MTIAKTTRFTATVARNGTIQLPEGAVEEGSSVQVVLKPVKPTKPQKLTPTQFVEKFRGFLKPAEVHDDKYNYLMKKHS